MIKGIRGFLKQFVPYGLMCVWLRKRYGIIRDRPLLFYSGIAKRLRRLVKFGLPYGLVMKIKRPDRIVSGLPSHPMLTAPTPVSDLSLLKTRVLIIAELSIPQCKYYRVDQKVSMLRSAAIPVEVANWSDSNDCLRKLQTATEVIFYRVPFFEVVRQELSEARRLGLRVGYDVDDIVFDETELVKNRSLDALTAKGREDVLRGAVLYRGLLEKCDFTIASTPTLSRFMARYCRGPAYVVPNAVCADMLPVRFRFPLGLDGKIVIGYGSGTNTHDFDFEECAGAVARILKKHPQTVLVLHGSLSVPDPLKEFVNRTLRVPFVPFAEYANALARFDVNLIPLEDSVFNDCKSNIKYLEASRFGVPSVASPRAEFRSVIVNGENGFLAEDEEAWFDALDALVSDAALRKRVGEAACRTVSREFDGRTVGSSRLVPAVQEQTVRPIESAKRILFVNILYSPTSFGGATILLENIVEEMSGSAQVAVFSISWNGQVPQGTLIRYRSGHAVCFRVESEPYGGGERDYRSPVVLKAFKEILDSYRPDVVHFHSIQQMGVGMLEVCNDVGVPYVVTAHDAWWICPHQFMLDGGGRYCHQDEGGIDLYRCAGCHKSKDLFTRWHLLSDLLRKSKAVLTPSDFQTDLYVKSGFPRELVRTNRNGILVPNGPLPRKFDGTVRFAYLGGKAEHKGYYFLKRIVNGLKGNYRLKLVDVNLRLGKKAIFASEWPEPKKVECCRPFDAADIDAFYSAVDVLLLPSCCKESFGLTVREALARNVWVIATRAGGDIERDVISDENGDLVDFGDEDGFRAAMQRLIDAPERLNGFVNPYRSGITTVEQQVKELLAIYGEIDSGRISDSVWGS